jgi:two-component system sensor histidine kinase GlrK
LKEGISLLREEVPGPLASGQREVVEILQHNVRGLQEQIESLLTLNAAALKPGTYKSGRSSYASCWPGW